MVFFGDKAQRGFTLVEVVIVVAIVAILGTVVISNINESRKKANDTQRRSDISQLQIALRLYRDFESTYPVGHDAGIIIGEEGALDGILAPYLPTTIRDLRGSASDSEYEYVYDSDFSCGGVSRKVLYAKTMERAGSGNWTTVCGTVVPGSTNTYGVILQ